MAAVPVPIGPVRPMVHPGPPSPERVVAVPTRSAATTVALPAGARLADALATAVRELGVVSAQVELLGGTFGDVSYCVPAACPDGSQGLSYSETRAARGPVSVVGGSATVGTRDGAPFVHCHAAWIDAVGALRAGHVWPETTVGQVPVHVVVHPLPGVHSRSTDDPETLMPVFTPYPGEGAPAGGRGAVFARLLPGQDALAAARELCRAAGFRRVTVRATLGSLVGPAFVADDGQTRVVDGPASEVISLLGEVDLDGPGAPWHALVVDPGATVHGGVIDPARSPVAVTLELLLLES